MLGDADKVCEDCSIVSEHWQVSSRGPEGVVGALLMDGGAGELGEGKDLETFRVHTWQSPVLGPTLQLHREIKRNEPCLVTLVSLK